MEVRPTHRKHTYRHDYSQRCIYHITIVVRDHRPLLGQLEGIAPDRTIITSTVDADKAIDARILYTPLGLQVSRCIRAIPAYGMKRGLDLQILALQVMDTHVHFVLYVRQPMGKETLGDLIRGLKTGCNKAYRKYLSSTSTLPCEAPSSSAPCESSPGSSSCEAPASSSFESSPGSSSCESSPPYSSSFDSLGAVRPETPFSPRPEAPGLFEPDYDDTILYKRGQLKRMIHYVHDNPYRKWVKRYHRNRFVPMRGILIAGRSYDAIGNIMLLGLLRHQVHVRSRFDETERRTYMNECVIKARCNHALVSPFISSYEKAVRDHCLSEGHSIIQLVNNGFTDFSSCPGDLYEYCRNGQILLLAPSELPHQDRPTPIQRHECVMLNARAEEIAK